MADTFLQRRVQQRAHRIPPVIAREQQRRPLHQIDPEITQQLDALVAAVALARPVA